MDRYGNLLLPAQVPSAAEAPADPLLDVVLDFAKAVVNYEGGAVWTALMPAGAKQPVQNTYTHDPVRYGIAETWLPALFLFREYNEASRWVAHDYWVRSSRLCMYWIPPRIASPALRGRVATFGGNLIHSAIDAVLDPGARHPAWVVPQDTDPAAQSEGSLVWHWAKVWELDVARAEWVDLELPMAAATADTGRMTYPALRCYWTLQERNQGVLGTDHLPLEGVTGTMYTGGDKEFLQFAFRLTAASLSPATGPTAGGTGVSILGTGFSVDVPPTVTFGGVAATGVAVSGPGALTCTTPAHAAGAVDVTVTNPDGETATLAAAFTYA